MYDQAKINEENCKNHRIWVTGLVHKEAYFLAPDVQSVLDDYLITPTYNAAPIEIEQIYIDMINSLHQDIDLQNNLDKTFKRISYCSNLDFDNISYFQNSWKLNFQNNQNSSEKNQLIVALLTIAKAKKYWNKIQPPQDWTSPLHTFREQLSQEIGKFYSRQECDTKNHIPFFFKILYSFIEND